MTNWVEKFFALGGEMVGHGGIDYYRTPDTYAIRIIEVPDRDSGFDDLAGDCFNPEHYESEEAAQIALADFTRRVKELGVWGYVAEFFNGQEWEALDSIWEFVGMDFDDSGYDTDLCRACVEAFESATERNERAAARD